MSDEFLTAEELAARWAKAKITVRTLAHWRERKHLKGPAYMRVASVVVYPLAGVIEYEKTILVIPKPKKKG